MSEFDPYLKWLGIREATRPINHYRLLGLDLYESDPDVISMAADRQMTHIRTYQNGPNGDLSQKILNELARARRCLLIPEKKAEYDEEMRASLRRPAPPIDPPNSSELVPPLAIPRPPVQSTVVDVDTVEPEIVESSVESKIGITADGNSRKSTHRRERKQLMWSLFGWVSGGLAAIGIGAWLIGSGLLPNSKPSSDPDPNPKVVAAGPGQPLGTGTPKSTTPPKTRTNPNRNPSAKPDSPKTGPVPPIKTTPAKTTPPKTTPPKTTPPKTTPPKTTPPKTTPPNNGNGKVAPVNPLTTDSAWTKFNLAKYPKTTAENRVLLMQIARSISDGNTIRFEPSGTLGGTHEITLEDNSGALLIGLAITTDKDLYIKTVQPVFLGLTRNAYLGANVGALKQPLNAPSQPVTYTIAKPGYAVGEIKLSVLDPIRCIQLKFMRITQSGLDPEDSYWSDWVGSVSGPVKSVTNDRGLPIIGIHSRFDMKFGVATLGLLGADQIIAVPAVTTSIPLDPGPLNPAPTNSVKPRTPVPSKRDREKAMDDVDRDYRDSMASIRSIRDVRRVATQLIFDGRSDAEDSVGQYGRYEKARVLGIYFGDAKTAVDALRAIDEQFEIEFWEEVLDTIEDAELKANTDTQADFKQTMDDLVDEAIANQQFGPAGKLIASASLMAKRARNVAAQDKYKNLRKQVVELGKIGEQAEKAREKLLADPDDPDANLKQGDYLFVITDDSNAAFEFWEKSNDAEIKDLVKKENSVDKKDGDQLVQLAADWHKMGNSNRSARDRKCLERARLHYQSASSLLTGLGRKAALSKIKEIDQILK